MARAARSAVCILAPDLSNGGSGVIISADGYGITNFHVVADMLETRRGVGGTSSGRTYPLEVLGIDPTGDLAMFRLIADEEFVAAPLGDSDALQVGDSVFAMGNPFMLAEDFSPTATFGIISGLNRYQYGSDARSLVYTDCIQIDASINPGNSGGPLFDMRGRVIGINGRASFKTDDPLRQRVNVGVAYAVSINQIKRFMPALKEGWLVEHGSLGATVVDTPDGVRFHQMLPASAAERVGIAYGDELIAFDGRPIGSANAFANVLGVYPAGWPVTVTYRRGSEEFRREVALDPLELPREVPWTKADPAWIRSVAQGATPTTLPFDAAAIPRGPSTEHSPIAPRIADLMTAVVKVYGGRIGGQRGYATGVIVAPEGGVVAPLALLLEATDLRVATPDGRVHRARVKHRDDRRQLALLEMVRSGSDGEADGTAPAYPGVAVDETARVAAGDGVYVIGNPFKIADVDELCSVHRGVASGYVRLDARQPVSGREVAYRGEVLLFDAMSSNTGSPGSAVFDAEGRLIGVVGEIVESRLTHTLPNYAFPAAEIAAFMRGASATKPGDAAPGHTTPAGPGYHGIKLSRFGYRQKLPFVESVGRDSPAARAGVRAGDLIISANGRPVPRAAAFAETCDRLHAGDELSLVIKRGEELVKVTVELEEAP